MVLLIMQHNVYIFKGYHSYFVLPVVLFTLLHKVVLTFEYVDEILNGDNSNEYLAIVLVILFIMLYKVVLTLETAVEILEGFN